MWQQPPLPHLQQTTYLPFPHHGTPDMVALEAFGVLLDAVMSDCSQRNIKACRDGFFEHCQTPAIADHLSAYMLAVATKGSVTFDGRLHIVYLLNDVIYHSDRQQRPWIRDTLYPRLLPILKTVTFGPPLSDTQRLKLTKVIDIWEDKKYFAEEAIANIQRIISCPPPSFPHYAPPPLPFQPPPAGMPHLVPPPFPPFPFPGMDAFRPPVPHFGGPPDNFLPFATAGQMHPTPLPAAPAPGFLRVPGNLQQNCPVPPTVSAPKISPQIPIAPQKPYFELPCSSMIFACLPDEPAYTPLPVSRMIGPILPQPVPQEMILALEKLRKAIRPRLSALDAEAAGEDQSAPDEGNDGWEIGFLDDVDSLAAKPRKPSARNDYSDRNCRSGSERDGHDRGRGRDRNYRGRKGHRRSSSRSSYSSSSSYSRSRSRDQKRRQTNWRDKAGGERRGGRHSMDNDDDRLHGRSRSKSRERRRIRSGSYYSRSSSSRSRSRSFSYSRSPSRSRSRSPSSGRSRKEKRYAQVSTSNSRKG